MSNLSNLQARKSAILAELATITSKASYTLDGQTVDHNAYRRSLLDEVRRINELIAIEQGPFEIRTETTTG